jgi:hypothetical protein
LVDLTMIVVDGATPELADDAARRLTAALKDRRDLFHTVRWPSGGPFFEREGLLFLSLDDVRSATDGLIKAAPMLVRLKADQSLRGVLVALSDMLSAVRSGETSLQDIEPAVTAFSETFRGRRVRPAGHLFLADDLQRQEIDPSGDAPCPAGPAGDGLCRA